MSEADRDRAARGGGEAPGAGESGDLTAQLPQSSLPAVTINDLQDKVMVAVKGAIAGALADRMPELRAPDIDLDFSYSSEEQAATLPAVASAQGIAVDAGAAAPHQRRGNRAWRGLQAGALAGAVAAGALIVTMPGLLGTGEPAPDSAPPLVATGQPPSLTDQSASSSAPSAAIGGAVPGVTTADVAPALPAAEPATPVAAPPKIDSTLVATATPPDAAAPAPVPLDEPAVTSPEAGLATRSAVTSPAVPVPAEAPATVQDVAKAAQLDLRNGDVAAARRRLLMVAERGELTVDGALLLAMSFDPNHLGSLASANAAPDRAEAERWYRTWFDLGAKSGLAADPSRLERLIRAMQP